MAFLCNRFQQAGKVFAKSPAFAKNGRHLHYTSVTTIEKNADHNTIPDAEITQKAETICKIVSTAGNSKNLNDALHSVNSIDLSANLILEVLKKLNNSGAMALSFFRWAEQQKSFHHTPEFYNALIESLGKIKQFKMVWILVEEMRKNGILSKDAFALVSRRFARANKVEEAIEAFERMDKKYGFNPTLQDYNRLLDTLSKSRHVEKAQEVFDNWKNKKFTPDIKSYTILLEGWGQKCNFLRLDEVYREMKEDGIEPDVVSYGILINSYCKAKRHDEAIKLYHEMVRKNISATPHIFCILINGLGSEKRLPEAINFFELSKGSGCNLEAPIYNAMIGAYCWSSRIIDAYKLVEEMRKYRLGPNTRTYNIILHHLIKLHKREEAYSLFQAMSDEIGCEPSVSTYEIMVRMFCHEGRTDMALRVWSEMKARGVLPGMHIFSVLINGLCDKNKLDDAYKYIQEMIGMGIRPSEFLFNNVKRALLGEGKEDIVIILDHKIKKLRSLPLLG